MRRENKKYLKWVRTLPCCHCGAPSEAHHLIGVGMGIMGSRASDIHAVPLCRSCHTEVHKCPREWPQTKWVMQTQDQAIDEGLL